MLQDFPLFLFLILIACWTCCWGVGGEGGKQQRVELIFRAIWMITVPVLTSQAQGKPDFLSTPACLGQPLISVRHILRLSGKDKTLK